MQSGICREHFSESRFTLYFLFVNFQENLSANGKVYCREMFVSFNIEVSVFLVCVITSLGECRWKNLTWTL